jgi:hypothetical protein
MTGGRSQRFTISVAVLAIGLVAHAPAASADLSFETDRSFIKAHAPLQQPVIGTTIPGLPTAAFFGNGYETWVDNLRDESEITQAGGHPDLTISFELQGTANDPEGLAKDLVTDLPAGAIADPLAVPRCAAADFNLTLYGHCPTASQVGVAASNASPLQSLSPLDSLVPPPGDAMMLGFKVLGFTAILHTGPRTDGDYGLRGVVADIPTSSPPRGTTLTLWGVPYDGLHDSHRFDTDVGVLGAEVTGAAIRPFTSAPTNCETGPLLTTLKVRSWGNPEQWITEQLTASEETGCGQIEFDPEVAARPTTDVADSPTGLDLHLRVPQDGECEALQFPEAGKTRQEWIAEGKSTTECGLQTSYLKETTIAMPEGLTLNPSGANGLEGCPSSEVGLTTPLGFKPIDFTTERAACPDASKIGSAEVETPLLEAPMPGLVYLAEPYDNPFESLLAIYVEVDDTERGIVAKFAGRIEADPKTGRLTATVEEGPQLPIEEIRLSLKQGPHALLRTPPTCGEYTTSSVLTPYASPESPVSFDHSFSIESSPQGTCERRLAPSFEAGTIAPIAGRYSPVVMNLSRADGSEEVRSVNLSLPEGLSAKLAGVPYCPGAALLTAERRDGRAERADPSCPLASRVGEVVVGAGAGPSPYYVRGDAYLAGPYKGAPISVAMVIPAIAGPFDLGTVVNRTALHVDPTTARITAEGDPLPSALRGIALDVRAIQVKLDRPEFSLNPTSCDPRSLDTTAMSASGAAVNLSSRFQVAACRARGFRPKVVVRLRGSARRNGHPALRVVVAARGGDANLGRVAVAMPAGTLIDLSHLRGICSRGQLAASTCPARSEVGSATAWSPLLEQPLTGSVDLVETSGKYPGLRIELDGQVHILLRGRLAAPRGEIRVTLDRLPDIPISRLKLDLAGGKRGLLVNSAGLCRRPPPARVTLVAQDGVWRRLRPRIAVACGNRRRGPG